MEASNAQPVIRAGHSAAAERTKRKKKMLTQSNNGAICTDWWKPSLRGGRERRRVSRWISWRGGGPARCRSGPWRYGDTFLWWVWGCACPLFEGKSILAHSHACLLSSRRTEAQDTLTGSIYTAPAIETSCHCRKERPLHISSLFEDGERWICRCLSLPDYSWERESEMKKAVLVARPQCFSFDDTLNDHINYLPSKVSHRFRQRGAAFLNIWPREQGDTWLVARSPLQFRPHLFTSLPSAQGSGYCLAFTQRIVSSQSGICSSPRGSPTASGPHPKAPHRHLTEQMAAL